MASKLPIARLITEIRKEHEAGTSCAAQAINHIIRCGQLLAALRASANGDFDTHIKEAGIAKTTAWRYMRVAHDVAKKRGKHLLEQGASLVDLYREFGLVKPCEGGGYRSEAYQKRKALAGAQLEMDFACEEFQPHLTALLKAANVEQLGETTLERLRRDLTAASARIDDVLKNRKAIDLPP